MVESRLTHAGETAELKDMLIDIIGEISGTAEGNIDVECVICDAVVEFCSDSDYSHKS